MSNLVLRIAVLLSHLAAWNVVAMLLAVLVLFLLALPKVWMMMNEAEMQRAWAEMEEDGWESLDGPIERQVSE